MESTLTLEQALKPDAAHKKALAKLGLRTVRDLFYHFPARYSDLSEIKLIRDIVPGDRVIVYGKIKDLKTGTAFRKKMPLGSATLEDTTGSIKVVWFNQPYLAKMFESGGYVKVSGKAVKGKRGLYLGNPEIERTRELAIDSHDSLFKKNGDNAPHHNETFYPVYPESRGITSRFFYHAVEKLIRAGALETMEDPIPEDILKRYGLPVLRTALLWIHKPRTEAQSAAARKRFAFEEVFLLQIAEQRARLDYEKHPAFVVAADRAGLERFLARFPFEPTRGQSRAIEAVLNDFSSGAPMLRLLEGDVGSGKTLVASAAAYAVATARPDGQSFGNLQVAYMAPTEILAKQHFESFISYFKGLNIPIGLITGSGCKKFPSKVNPGGATDISRAQLLKWAANGEIPILIGTHALIQKSVTFKHLALAIIDEQHRFGVRQRSALARGKNAEQTPIDAEETGPLMYRDLTYRIRNALFNVKKELGLGHKEVIYQKALEEEFIKLKIPFSREKQIPIFYHTKKVGTYQPDFVVDEKVIVELKALPFLGTEPKKQLWNYLKGSEYRLALLANFGNTELAIERIVYDKARVNSASSPHTSASVPHILSMTATPIPRTLALTVYGNLDLTLLDEMPHGRKEIKTEIVLPGKREHVYQKVREEIAAGRQAYVICPRINEPDPTKELALVARSVKAEAERLKKEVFPECEIAILHSKMTDAAKEETMRAFSAHETDILVATSMVEVGVNVPNATVILIEGAERFGLAQLHQLRGRVIRSNYQAYCFLFSDTKSAKSVERLKAIQKAKNGFELAELDLLLRGAGELGGGKQWGISDLGMEAIKNLKMVEAARTEAQTLVREDASLAAYPELRARMTARSTPVHFE